jgi:glycosyltransferase involved in cell wall biosynthesis
LLTIVIPAYNAETFLARCLDSVVGADGVEVLVIDDGSTDGTAALAMGYVERHPEVRVVSQRNRGHGGAINTGLAKARGEYLKVVDADDWLERSAYGILVETLRRLPSAPEVDLVVTNFVYDKVGRRQPRVMRYRSALPTGRVVRWDQTRRFPPGCYMLMHALTYRTEVLRRSGLRLPEHSSYVDNLYAFIPLAEVHRLLYVDVDLYRYVIGRADQSVSEAVMLTRLDQQLAVNRAMFAALGSRPLPGGRHGDALVHYLGIVCGISSIFLLRSGTRERLADKAQLWSDLRQIDPVVYRHLRRGLLGHLVNLPGGFGRRMSLAAYAGAQRIVGFN